MVKYWLLSRQSRANLALRQIKGLVTSLDRKELNTDLTDLDDYTDETPPVWTQKKPFQTRIFSEACRFHLIRVII